MSKEQKTWVTVLFVITMATFFGILVADYIIDSENKVNLPAKDFGIGKMYEEPIPISKFISKNNKPTFKTLW